MKVRANLISGCMVGFEWCESAQTLIIDLLLLCILLEFGEQDGTS